MDALQALVDWLYKVEPQLAEDLPVHGDLDLVMNLMDAHKVIVGGAEPQGWMRSVRLMDRRGPSVLYFALP